MGMDSKERGKKEVSLHSFLTTCTFAQLKKLFRLFTRVRKKNTRTRYSNIGLCPNFTVLTSSFAYFNCLCFSFNHDAF